jgi:hypothetical protein
MNTAFPPMGRISLMIGQEKMDERGEIADGRWQIAD